ncbi:MAG TPA: glycosyltransferase [Candidatus Korarchaeota archaeon]|nr:glycosyltransferase [Candidatus Korarchaeota archaeon]
MAVANISLNFCGGAQAVALEIINALANRGHSVTLITADKVNWEKIKDLMGFSRIVRREISVVSYDLVESMEKDPKNALHLVFSFLRKLFGAKKRYDVVVNSYGDLDVSVNFADITLFASFPFSLSGLFPDMAPIYLKKPFFITVYKIFRELFVRRPSGILLTNSIFMKRILRKYLGWNAAVLHPPVKVDDFYTAERKENVVVTVSRYVPGKELYKVLLVARKVPKVRFIVVGRTYDEGHLSILMEIRDSLQLEGRVEFLSDLPRKQLLDLLSRAKVYLHTKRREPFGMSVIEVMASGCVPIVPREGGPWTDILNEKDGLYGYSYHNIEEAAMHIKRLISEDSLREKISKRCIERSRSFSREVFHKRIIEIVESCALDSRTRGINPLSL